MTRYDCSTRAGGSWSVRWQSIEVPGVSGAPSRRAAGVAWAGNQRLKRFAYRRSHLKAPPGDSRRWPVAMRNVSDGCLESYRYRLVIRRANVDRGRARLGLRVTNFEASSARNAFHAPQIACRLRKGVRTQEASRGLRFEKKLLRAGA